MTVVAGSTKRDVIPRWRDVNATIANGEIGVKTEEPKLDERSEKELKRSRMAWELDRSQIMSAELASTGLVLGVPSQVQDAVSTLLEGELSPSLKYLARVTQRIEGDDNAKPEASLQVTLDEVHLYLAIAGLKQALVREPRRPLAWLELARLYSQLGQIGPATNCVSRAVFLAPNSRYVLRSAAAFFTNAGNAERAHSILVKAERTGSDPWLIAAELATASKSKQKPRFVKNGLRILGNEDFRPLALSELSAELATLEARDGHSKRARKLVALALSNPTENSVAQVESLSEMDKSIQLPVDSLELPTAFEARSRSALEDGDWLDSVESAALWLSDQPFSNEAAVFASYVAISGLRDFHLALDFANRGLKANPYDAGLMNNAAVAEIEVGNLSAAEDLLRRAKDLDAPRHARIALEATQGLLDFRNDLPDNGRAHYEESMRLAQGEKIQTQHVLASVMLAREEIRYQTPMSSTAVQRAERLIKRTDSKVVKSWFESVESEYKKLPEDAR